MPPNALETADLVTFIEEIFNEELFCVVVHGVIKGTRPENTTEFYGRPNGRFAWLKCNRRRNKLHRANEVSHFLKGSFNNRGNLKIPV